MRRSLVTTLVALAAIGSLTGCTKPLPKITILSGSTTVVVSPQSYCFDPTHCHNPGGKAPTVHAAAGTSLLVDVPREIADHPWSVSSGKFSVNQTFQVFQGDNYSSGTITNTHTARIEVPYGLGNYALAIQANGKAWIAIVDVHR